jgi:hypothetical protein
MQAASATLGANGEVEVREDDSINLRRNIVKSVLQPRVPYNDPGGVTSNPWSRTKDGAFLDGRHEGRTSLCGIDPRSGRLHVRDQDGVPDGSK